MPDRRKLPGNGATIGRPGNNPKLPDKSKLPDNNNTVGRPGSNKKLPGGSTDIPVTRPVNKDNNVLSDKDGNIFKKDPVNNNWQTRDYKSKDWKPVTNGNVTTLPELNKQQQFRDRAESRQNNFGRDVPVIKTPSPSVNPSPVSTRQVPVTRPAIARPAPANTGQARPERKRN